MFAQGWSIFYEPLHTAFEAREFVDDSGVQCFYCEQWNEADHRADLERERLALLRMQYVIIKTVLCVPQGDTFAAQIVDRITNVNEMLKKLAGYILIG